MSCALPKEVKKETNGKSLILARKRDGQGSNEEFFSKKSKEVDSS